MRDDNSVLDLAGDWGCRLDRDDVGEREGWAATTLDGDRSVRLPGSLAEQGIGDPIDLDTPWTGSIVDKCYFTDARYAPYREAGNTKVPFWLQPRVYYRGQAWFQREVTIPADWDGAPVTLELERVHWGSTLWLDGQRIGEQLSLTTAHRFDLGHVTAGQHTLTIRVDNRTLIDVGPNSHSISDHTQGNWNGIVGAIRLVRRSEVRISRVRVFPDIAHRRAEVRIDISAPSQGIEHAQVRVRGAITRPDGSTVQIPESTREITADFGEDLASRSVNGTSEHLDLTLELGPDAPLWDEFEPSVGKLDITLDAHVAGNTHHDESTTSFGLREVRVEGGQLTINGRPLFVRGTLECCVFPLTGYPPTDVEAWRQIMTTVKDHGLNLVRFHSWCPPEAAFVAADQTGIYLQVEGPFWANQGARLGEGGPIDRFVHDETARILRDYGNHPSFVMMAHGNEPSGRDTEFLSAWVTSSRAADPRRLYTSAAGWPAIEASDFDNIPEPRTHRWGEGLGSAMNAQAPNTLVDYAQWVKPEGRPVISHEVGQWCVHPDFDEIEQYTGVMRAANLEIFADQLAANGMADQAREMLHASGRLQLLCYKEEVEAALRTPGFGGFHLLSLTDFPGQGTALVGVLNAFWRSKGYCTPDEFSRFCGPTVPLARLPRRTLSTTDALTFDVQVAHFGSAPLDARVTWSLTTIDGRVLGTGLVAEQQIPLGNRLMLGPVTIAPEVLAAVETPGRVRLELAIEAEHDRFINDWNLWVFSSEQPEQPDTVAATGDLDEAIRLAGEGRTVLLEAAQLVDNDVSLGFTPVFWNTAWTLGQEPHTLGLLHDPAQPALAGFPSEGHTDWQWWEALHGARAMIVDGLPTELRPAVQAIDTWFTARRLGVLVEARMGAGRIMVSSLNLAPVDEEGRPRLAAAQLRRSLLDHLASDENAPTLEITAEQLATLLRPSSASTVVSSRWTAVQAD